MTDVWDFERDLYPFNLERARDEFDAFWPANNLVSSNDFNVPTFADYREPGDPPMRGRGLHAPRDEVLEVQVPLANVDAE